jgi:acyl dehydratase
VAVDTNVIGKQTPGAHVTLERGPVTQFARAVKDANPVYTSLEAARAAGFTNIPVPPTMSFAWEYMGAFGEQRPESASLPNPMHEVMGSLMSSGGLILHGEQDFEFHRTPVVGDELVAEGRISDVYEKESKGRTMTFLVTETVWKDAKTGDPVVTARFNLIHRS